jgi:hypothetical protein
MIENQNALQNMKDALAKIPAITARVHDWA